jgi:uncharacterized protein
MPGELFRQRRKEHEMKIEGQHKIKAPRDRLWRLLTDPEVLSRCVPGCQSLEATEDGTYKMVMKAGVGSIKGLFNGSIKLDEIREPEHYKMIVEGKGPPGFLKGEGTIDLPDEGEETTVSYQGEVMVGGTLASVGQRMIQATSKMMVGQFFAAIEAEAEALAKAEDSNEPYEPPKQGFIRNVIRQVKK